MESTKNEIDVSIYTAMTYDKRPRRRRPKPLCGKDLERL